MSFVREVKEPQANPATAGQRAVGALNVYSLPGEDEAEVLDFLSVRPLHTVYIAGLIRDNGLVSPLNRGTFHACRNAAGELAGVALIGHVTQVEVRTEDALAAFARLAQSYSSAHVIFGEQQQVQGFWEHYAAAGQPLRLACRELLLEQCWPVAAAEAPVGLRLATLADLPLVMPAQAEMAFAESGVNPLKTDPEGFRQRYARRIEKQRVWVAVEEGRLIFKADIMAETPQATYLEGVYVSVPERGKGYGLRCLSQLGHTLLHRARSICLLVNERNPEAINFYHRAGYKLRGYFDTIYLQRAAGPKGHPR